MALESRLPNIVLRRVQNVAGLTLLAAFASAYVAFDFYFQGGISFAQLNSDCVTCTDMHPNMRTVTAIPTSTTMLNSPIAGSPLGANGQLTSGVAVNASLGTGNYNAGFITLKMGDWHGLTLQENFTYSKALGTVNVVQASSEFTVVPSVAMPRS